MLYRGRYNTVADTMQILASRSTLFLSLQSALALLCFLNKYSSHPTQGYTIIKRKKCYSTDKIKIHILISIDFNNEKWIKIKIKIEIKIEIKHRNKSKLISAVLIFVIFLYFIKIYGSLLNNTTYKM